MALENNARKIFDLAGKTAVVTGGLGQLGTQYSKTLLEAGAKVAIFDNREDKLNDFFMSNKNNLGLKLYRVDITKKSDIVDALKKVIERLGRPSILINNAALDVPPGTQDSDNELFEQYPEAAWDKTIETNLKGLFLTSQIIGGYMAQNGGGSIINISSVYGNVSPDQRIYEYRKKKGKAFVKPISYATTKSGVLNFTRYLAVYWASKKVRVNTLSPGGVFNNQDEEFIMEYSKRVPMGRMANEDEFNGAILFLASEASSYMTGANIIIDGGLTAW